VVFRDAAGEVLATRRTANAYLLPASGLQAMPGSQRSPALTRALARVAARHGGVTGIWVQRLWDGRAAGWNADAEFPAASTVKLPLAVGAIMRMGKEPWTHPSWPDVVAALRYSDNEAADHLVSQLGSGCATTADAAAAEGLRRLGAHHSTFTGCYAAEELQPRLPAGGVAQTPSWSNRHTTARDLGRMLYALQAAAVPTPAARRQTGIPAMKARLILGILLTAAQDGQNATLFNGGLEPGTPIAEKNGWRQNEQHGAAIAYTTRGPLILVVLTQRPGGASFTDTRAIGREVSRAALRG
jgi:beta-lactamase class A